MIALAGLLERLRHCPSVHRPLVLAQCRDATWRAVLCGEIKPRSVGLAVELAFTGVVAAPRHKAGLALHEARVVRVFAGAEVGRLTDLRALLD